MSFSDDLREILEDYADWPGAGGFPDEMGGDGDLEQAIAAITKLVEELVEREKEEWSDYDVLQQSVRSDAWVKETRNTARQQILAKLHEGSEK